MVKVEGLTQEDVAFRDRASKLVEIAREFFQPHNKVEFSLQTRTIDINDGQIVVHPDLHQVAIGATTYLISAKMLAQKYEESTGQEFTVKEVYTLGE